MQADCLPSEPPGKRIGIVQIPCILSFAFCLPTGALKECPKLTSKDVFMHVCHNHPLLKKLHPALGSLSNGPERESIKKKKKLTVTYIIYKGVDWASPKPCRTAQEENSFEVQCGKLGT